MTDINAFAQNYSTPAYSLAGFHGHTSLRGGSGEEGKGRGREGGREGREWWKKGRGCPVFFPEPTCQP